MNYADTEKVRHVLILAGYEEADDIRYADVIVLNSCSVRQKAEDRVLGMARVIRKLKLERPGCRVVLTGCMAQRIRRVGCQESVDTKYAQKLRQICPWIDLFMPVGDVAMLQRYLRISQDTESYMDIPQARTSPVTAYVPISSGCDNFCTYCVVPYTRGGEISRSRNVIVRDVKDVIAKKYALVTLLGQNVNSWTGVSAGSDITFSDLLREVDSIPGEYWITYLTSHPKDFGNDVIRAMAESIHICPYVSLAVQSGSDRILERMNRGYTRDQYLSEVDELRDAVPGVRISTDIIVGFPGESDGDFARTKDLVEKVRFGMIYLSEYSPRYPAPSVRMAGEVPRSVAVTRRKIIEDLQRTIMREDNKCQEGTTQEILITGQNIGKTRDLRDVRFRSEVKVKPGTFAIVSITSSSESGFVGDVAV